MPLDINMDKVYDFMKPVSDAMNTVYDYAVDFAGGFVGTIQSVSTIFG